MGTFFIPNYEIYDGKVIANYSPDFMKYMPMYYHEEPVIIALFKAIGYEMGLRFISVADLRRQFFISTATWGLKIWEGNLNLTTNLKLTYEERREIISAKLRGRGTTTKKMVKNTAAAYSGGEVELEDRADEFLIIITFTGTKGIPSTLEAFEEQIHLILPAHLAIEYRFTYTIWRELLKVNWASVKKYTWEELRTAKIGGN